DPPQLGLAPEDAAGAERRAREAGRGPLEPRRREAQLREREADAGEGPVADQRARRRGHAGVDREEGRFFGAARVHEGVDRDDEGESAARGGRAVPGPARVSYG